MQYAGILGRTLYLQNTIKVFWSIGFKGLQFGGNDPLKTAPFYFSHLMT